jgi:hypothetical protein
VWFLEGSRKGSLAKDEKGEKGLRKQILGKIS